MKKKVLSILLSAAMVAAMVSGCGSKDEGSSSAELCGRMFRCFAAAFRSFPMLKISFHYIQKKTYRPSDQYAFV